MSGDGKTTSTIINEDGKCFYLEEGNPMKAEKYEGMNPATHYIVNLDKKDLPFPSDLWNSNKGNYAVTDKFEDITKILKAISESKNIKSVSFDTLNLYLAYKEHNDRKKLTFDQWRDVANDVIELNEMCNTILRNDQIAYIMGHIELITDPSGEEKKVLSVIGKKSKRQMPEGFYPICLFTYMEYGDRGNNKYYFETKARKSSAKTPIGMFKDFLIPNSLVLVDKTVRNYYKI